MTNSRIFKLVGGFSEKAKQSAIIIADSNDKRTGAFMEITEEARQSMGAEGKQVRSSDSTVSVAESADDFDLSVQPALNDVYTELEAEILRSEYNHQEQMAALSERITGIENLGDYSGAFNTYAALPKNISGFLPKSVTVNDFATIRQDELHGNAVTRYVISGISSDGAIAWTYDLTYSTDISGKQDKLNRTVGGNDNATGTVNDAGGNLSIPVPVALAAPAAQNNITAQAAETVSLRTAIQRAYNNILHLFSNKADKAAGLAAATKTKITYNAQGIVTAGADLAASDIPNLDAAKITSGTFADARIASASAWNSKVARTGDTMTGNLTVPAILPQANNLLQFGSSDSHSILVKGNINVTDSGGTDRLIVENDDYSWRGRIRPTGANSNSAGFLKVDVYGNVSVNSPLIFTFEAVSGITNYAVGNIRIELQNGIAIGALDFENSQSVAWGASLLKIPNAALLPVAGTFGIVCDTSGATRTVYLPYNGNYIEAVGAFPASRWRGNIAWKVAL